MTSTGHPAPPQHSRPGLQDRSPDHTSSKKRLRVLVSAFVCCPPGTPGFTGGESALGWSLLQQISRYHEAWVITRTGDRTSIEQQSGPDPIPGVRFCYVDLPAWMAPLLRLQGAHQFYYYLWQFRSYWTARKLHKQIGFDLFHHLTYANDWMVSFIGAWLPVPYVRGPGGGAQRTPNGLGVEYPWSVRVWEQVRFIGQWIFRHDPIFRRGQRRARAILVCNKESLAEVSRTWPEKAHLFPVNGVSADDFSGSGNGLVGSEASSPPGFKILTAGTLLRIKGFSLAIRAFKQFSSAHRDARLTIVGSGPEETRLRSLVKSLGLEERIEFLGWIARDQLLSQYQECDVFLFPSLRDGGGGVVIEAMAAGKPVVCLDAGGPGMHVTTDCGVAVIPKTVDQVVADLADALERLHGDGKLRNSLGKQGRARAIEHYQWDNLGDQLANIYQSAATGAEVRAT